MTKIYKTKPAAEKEADKFALEKLHQDYEVSFRAHSAKPSITVFYWSESQREHKKEESFNYIPQPEIAKDTPVWVRDRDFDDWGARYATGNFTEDGKIKCYSNGKTSFTAHPEFDYCSWNEFSLTDPNKTEEWHKCKITNPSFSCFKCNDKGKAGKNISYQKGKSELAFDVICYRCNDCGHQWLVV